MCHYDVNLTYPQQGLLPSIPLIEPSQRDLPFYASQLTRHTFMHELARRAAEKSLDSQFSKRDLAKRDSSQFLKDRPFDKLDPWVSSFQLSILIWHS